MGIKLTNNAFATLAAGINSSATSITLTSGQGARFPTLTASDYFYATLIDTSNNLEIVKCTARSTDVLTVVRAQETTTARAYNTGDRIEIRLTAQTFIDAATTTPAAVSDQVNTSTGYFDLPSGTTAQRPGSPFEGIVRHNTDTDAVEVYDSSLWKSIKSFYDVEYLVIAGGGSGDYGGGGAGGYRCSVAGESSGGNFLAEHPLEVRDKQAYIVTIGSGGAAYADGNHSKFGPIVSIGGGGGMNESGNGRVGRPGGSGVGSRYVTSSGGSPGFGIAGQGFPGGGAADGISAYTAGGGGGGAGAVGGYGNGTTAGSGGTGISSSITGTATTRAGGGGGGTNSGGAVGSGGAGGGANGSGSTSVNNGGANTGGGGGAGNGNSGNGGSGIVIIRYLGAQRGTGGTVTSSGGYTIHTFTSSGTYTA